MTSSGHEGICSSSESALGAPERRKLLRARMPGVSSEPSDGDVRESPVSGEEDPLQTMSIEGFPTSDASELSTQRVFVVYFLTRVMIYSSFQRGREILRKGFEK